MVLYNYINYNNHDTWFDAWYIPERHDLFEYDEGENGWNLRVTNVNPDFYTYNPDDGNDAYNFDYQMPSFSCLAAAKRKTDQIPNGGCNPCGEEGCLTGTFYDGNPFSGCGSQCRYTAITPNHLLAIKHYWAADETIGTTRKFYGSNGGFQEVKFTKLYKLGADYGNDAIYPELDAYQIKELAILEFQAADPNCEGDCEYNKSLGEGEEAPEIKYPYFMPEGLSHYDPIIDYMNGLIGIGFDQDMRGYVVGVNAYWNPAGIDDFDDDLFNIDKLDYRIGLTSLHGSSDDDHNLQYLIDNELAIREDMAAFVRVKGESSSPLFTYIPEITGDSPIFLRHFEISAFTNTLQDYVLPIIEDYDNENNTTYASDIQSRILTRSDLGVPLVGACCVAIYPPEPPTPTGACCVGNVCMTGNTQSECEQANGTYHGPNSVCTNELCGNDPTGSCCIDTGQCIDGQTLITCSQVNGTYMGHNTYCDGSFSCSGACCISTGQCIDGQTLITCSQANGTYMGHRTDCNESPCSGACCIGTGQCTDGETLITCSQENGTYIGNGSCTQDNICAPAMKCLSTTEFDCINLLDGNYHGDDSSCDDWPCFGYPAKGACCDATSYCSSKTQTECSASGGIYQGNFVECLQDASWQYDYCPEDFGVCCKDQECLGDDITKAMCEELESGDYWFGNESCSEHICDVGGCCLGFLGCFGDYPELWCIEAEGSFQGVGTSCSTIEECLQVGACCVGNVCMASMIQSECEQANGTYHGDDSVCTNELCISGCVVCSNQENSSMKSKSLMKPKISINQKLRENNTNTDLQGYTNVKLPSGECIYMECVDDCPYPECFNF